MNHTFQKVMLLKAFTRQLSLIGVFFSFLPCFVFAQPSTGGPFGKEIPYQQAVPNLVDEVVERATPVQNKQQIFDEYAVPITERLPEFLDDWIEAMKEVSEQEFPDLDVDKFQELADKWEEIVFEYPGLQGLGQIMVPVAEELLEGLPELRPRQGNEPPIANIFELYQALEADNPWGVATIFQIPPLPPEVCITNIRERIQELIKMGRKNTRILHRRTRKECNGDLVFCEVIEDNEVIKQVRRVGDVTILHEVLKQMKENNEDPQIIALVEEWIRLIDENLELAWRRGELSDYLYFYLYSE